MFSFIGTSTKASELNILKPAPPEILFLILFFAYGNIFSQNFYKQTIKKNQSIGIVGKSGSGKTTLIDIILGLLTPQSGGIYYNEKSLKEEV